MLLGDSLVLAAWPTPRARAFPVDLSRAAGVARVTALCAWRVCISKADLRLCIEQNFVSDEKLGGHAALKKAFDAHETFRRKYRHTRH